MYFSTNIPSENLGINKNKDCIICGGTNQTFNDPQIKVSYTVCDDCGFVYKDNKYHLNYEDELKEYQNHNNSFQSIGYVRMFENLITDFIRPLKISGKGLDYGSGPGPVLKELLRREGFEMFDYDPFFNDNIEHRNNNYDLITSTEVIEHFVNPIKEFQNIKALMKPNAYLVIMTEFNTYGRDDFLKWRYRREASHVSFYTLRSLETIADKLNLEIVNCNNKNVIVFKNK